MAQDKAGISKVFSMISRHYDFLNHTLSFNNDRSWRKEFIGKVRVKKGVKILDLCTGSAETAIAFAKRTQASRVFGLDFSWGMLKVAKEKIENLDLGGRVVLIEGDVFIPPFKEGSFDIVSMSFGLRNLFDYQAGISAIVNMAKKGGEVAVLEFSPPPGNIFAKAISLYLKKMLPLIAQMFGGRRDAYSYLSASISAFLSPRQILDCMGKAGLSRLRVYRMGWGLVYAYYGEKE